MGDEYRIDRNRYPCPVQRAQAFIDFWIFQRTQHFFSKWFNDIFAD